MEIKDIITIKSLNEFCILRAKNIIVRHGQLVGFGNDAWTGVI